MNIVGRYIFSNGEMISNWTEEIYIKYYSD